VKCDTTPSFFEQYFKLCDSDKSAILRALHDASVAQMDRVLVSEAKGRGFDSRRAHQIRLSGHSRKIQPNAGFFF
jgi:hypothetical protein